MKSRDMFFVIAEVYMVDGLLLQFPVYSIVAINPNKKNAEAIAKQLHIEKSLHTLVVKAPCVLEQ